MTSFKDMCNEIVQISNTLGEHNRLGMDLEKRVQKLQDAMHIHQDIMQGATEAMQAMPTDAEAISVVGNNVLEFAIEDTVGSEEYALCKEVYKECERNILPKKNIKGLVHLIINYVDIHLSAYKKLPLLEGMLEKNYPYKYKLRAQIYHNRTEAFEIIRNRGVSPNTVTNFIRN